MVDVLQEFKILLNNPPSGSTFFPGTEVTGTLVVKVNEPKNYNDIVIYLTGKGYVYWTESTGSGDDRRTETYTANETYVELQSVGWSRSQAPDGVLPPGEYHFQFRFLLPPLSPSSFESHVGWIRYTLGARIDKGYPYAPHVLETKILVNQIIDTNAAQLRLPYRLQNQKTAGFLCCQSGPISTFVEVPRTGYCVGEEIPFRVTVENGGSRPVRVIVELSERVIYTARGHHKWGGGSHATQGSEPVEPHRTLVWVPEVNVFKIPITTPTAMKSNLIERSFFITFKTLIPNVLFNPTLSIPITVGNVPFNPDPPTATPSNPPPVAMNPPPVSSPPPPLGLPAPDPFLAPPPQPIPSVTPETVPKNPELTSSEPPTYLDAVTKY